ncbi:MAG: MFS transporter [Thermoplasmata archaeon]
MANIYFDELTKTRKFILITILSSMGILMDGYTLSIFSTALMYLQNTILSKAIFVSLGASSIYIGMLIGSLIFGRIADSYGRRRIYILDLSITAIFLILTGLSQNLFEFIAFEIFVGMGIGADYPISSSIQAEFSPKKIRGRYLVINMLFWTIGSIIFYIVSIPIVLYFGKDAWRVMYISGAIIPIIVIISRTVIPETPYFLVKSGKVEDAKKVTREFAKDVGIDNAEPPKIRQRKTSFKELRNYIPLIIFTSLSWFSYDVASYGVWNYTPSLFFSSLSYVYSIIATLLETLPVIVGVIICILFIDKLGRKVLQSLGFGLAGISLLSFSILFLKTTPPFIYIFIAFALMHVFHNIGPTNTTYLYPVEIFPTYIRATAMGISTAVSRIGAILGVFVFPLIISMLNVSYGLMFFAIFEFLGFFLTIFLGVETKNRSIE